MAATMACAMLALVSGPADAVTVDLASSTQGTINGAIFTINDLQPAGSGVIDPFLTVQNSPSEQGYNSGTNNNFDTKRVPQFNHEITVGSLAKVTLNGTEYYEFLVDVNEPNAGSKALISLDRLKIYTSTTTQSSVSTDGSGLFNGSLGTLRYDMDGAPAGNSVVLYDDQHHGSGQADITIFVPVANFTGASASDFLYMYQAWGYTAGYKSGATYEETAALRAIAGSPAVVPESSTVLLLGTGFVGLGALMRLRRR
jgi:hypothetical protein